MRRRYLHLSVLGLLILLAASAQQNVSARSSIFNVPTTNVLPPQKLYVEADYITHPAPYEKGGFQFFGPTIIYGVRKNFEVGLNFFLHTLIRAG